MKVTVDTNVLVRTLVPDDPDQTAIAVALLAEAESVVVGLQTLTELVWVLRSRYGVARGDVAAAIRDVCDSEKVVVDRPVVDAGLACLEAGGDFADGVVAYEGSWAGGEVFASFDRKAVKVLAGLGYETRPLSSSA